jgi:hypothetical protein
MARMVLGRLVAMQVSTLQRLVVDSGLYLNR